MEPRLKKERLLLLLLLLPLHASMLSLEFDRGLIECVWMSDYFVTWVCIVSLGWVSLQVPSKATAESHVFGSHSSCTTTISLEFILGTLPFLYIKTLLLQDKSSEFQILHVRLEKMVQRLIHFCKMFV
jgi:hypothetical protein